ncbi:MAG: hypothetical protein IJ220_07000 [Clostridia bacterium]|nr:hypothetical protein [Clostridia bacterium]
MKKMVCISCIIFTLLFSMTNAVMSENFEKVLSLINVPTKNIDGFEINEEIYHKYGLIVYGTPTDITKNQRWKDVPTGKWKNEITGKQGEYRILGYSLTGTVVNNEVFPDDYNSGISPEEWNYITIGDAISSWNDTEKYQTKAQLEYMLTQRLTRNGITYNITASLLGLDKARLEAYATWKTAGSIFTLKKDSQGGIWEATFRIPPMAAEANFSAKLNIIQGQKYQFEPEQETLEIPISFGAEVTNLGQYAKKEDIKNISSELEVENNLIDKIHSENETSILKDSKIVIHKSDYPNANKITLVVKNTSILETCFHAEAPMVDMKETKIEIVIHEDMKIEDEGEYIKVDNINSRKENDIPRPIIQEIRLYKKTITNRNNKSKLSIAKKTNTQFICAGQILVVEATVLNNPQTVTLAIEGNSKIQTLDDLTKRFVYDEPKRRGEKLIYSSLDSLKASYHLPANMKNEEGIYKLEYIIPYGTKQSLNSWSTLRTISNNAFDIDKSKLFTRIASPYLIKIYAKNDGGSTTRTAELDVFERWDTIYNRNISEFVK